MVFFFKVLEYNSNCKNDKLLGCKLRSFLHQLTAIVGEFSLLIHKWCVMSVFFLFFFSFFNFVSVICFCAHIACVCVRVRVCVYHRYDLSIRFVTYYYYTYTQTCVNKYIITYYIEQTQRTPRTEHTNVFLSSTRQQQPK